MGILDKLFGRKKDLPKEDFNQEEYDQDYELKKSGLEEVLGEMYNMVGHAIIPFAIGGAVDMYYFTNHIQGTGFATMELLDLDGNGPLSNRHGTYELVAFTKHNYNSGENQQTPFNIAERNACGYLTKIGLYSSQAVLNPMETVEIPNGEGEENTCLVFDKYEPDNKQFKVGERKHHLLLCLQVFRSEMQYARENGSEELFKLLKANNIYPYGDLDREPIA